MKIKFKIIETLDNKTNERSMSAKHRIGRECFFEVDNVSNGVPLIVEYDAFSCFVTSAITNSFACDYGRVITTIRTTYFFAYIIDGFDTETLLLEKYKELTEGA